MIDRYAVFGHPVRHSKSPQIHAAFAAQTGQALTYEAIEAPGEGFAASLDAFRAAGGKGANVTVPFKEEAFRLSARLTARARRAGAANTLTFAAEGVLGDNTDGAGLVRDLTVNRGVALGGCSVLVLGAGGAARGILGPLLDAAPARLFIANRTPAKAVALAKDFGCAGGGFDAIPETGFDIVINATAASLAGELPPLPEGALGPETLAYDMMYGCETPFMAHARQCGSRVADGLGMLVEQAAEAFFVWRGVHPATAPVLAALRAGLEASRKA